MRNINEQLDFLQNSEEEVRDLIINSKAEIREELYKKFSEERKTLKEIQRDRKEKKLTEHDEKLKVNSRRSFEIQFEIENNNKLKTFSFFFLF
jgi:hypothetical protein